MPSDLSPHDRILAARIRMLERQGFFGLIAARLELKPDTKCNETWTDGKTFTYNPDWVKKASFEDLLFAVAKASCHCALVHPLRRAGRDYRLWQKSIDSAVYEQLQSADFRLPDGVKIAYIGKSAEEIYADLYAKQPPQDDRGGGKPKPGDQSSGDDQKPGKPGKPGDDQGSKKGKPGPDGQNETPHECRDQPGDDGQEMDASQTTAAEQAALREIAAMALQAKASGAGLPGDFEERLTALLYPKMDWLNLVRDYCQKLSRSDYSYKRPNRIGWSMTPRRFLPSMISDDALDTLVFAVDTSSSLNSRKLQLAAGGLADLMTDLNFQRLIVLYCDTKIQAVQEYEPGDELDFKAVGRGCTSLKPPFQWLDGRNITPDLMIYFTDMEGNAPEHEPDFPLIWLDQDGNEARANRIMKRYGINYGRYIPMQC